MEPVQTIVYKSKGIQFEVLTHPSMRQPKQTVYSGIKIEVKRVAMN